MSSETPESKNHDINDFIAYLKSLKPQDGNRDLSYQEKWLRLSALLDHVSSQNNTVFFLWDASTSRFLYLSDKNQVLGGYDPAEFTSDAGMAFTISNIHPDYRHAALIFNQTAFNYCIEHNEFTPGEVIVNFNVLYKKKGGIYFQFLQHSVVVEVDERGYPLLLLSYGYDITHLLKEHTANLIITTPHDFLMWTYNFEKKSLEPVTPLTVQEKKVLQLLSEAKHTKEIADILCTSPHTVDTHRRNLLKKTNCVDTTALVTYLKMVGFMHA